MPRMRHSLAALADPPAELRAGLDAFDPDREAVVLATFLNESPSLDGRPIVAHRRPAWVALEDKTTVDDLLDRAGVARARSIVVPVADAAAARHALDAGHGTVWAADSSRGLPRRRPGHALGRRRRRCRRRDGRARGASPARCG